MARSSSQSLWQKIGVWSFVAGLLIAIILGLVAQGAISQTMAWVLGILGVLVGILNIMEGEVVRYLLASITFLVAAESLGAVLDVIPGVAGFVSTFFDAVRLFVAPGAAIVALRALYDIART